MLSFVVFGLTLPGIKSKTTVLAANVCDLDHWLIDYNRTSPQLFLYCRFVFIVNFLAEEEWTIIWVLPEWLEVSLFHHCFLGEFESKKNNLNQ